MEDIRSIYDRSITSTSHSASELITVVLCQLYGLVGRYLRSRETIKVRYLSIGFAYLRYSSKLGRLAVPGG